MAKKKAPARPELPQPVLRAWHVIMTSGADVTVTASRCDTDMGVLAFYRYEDSPGFDTDTLVRAFGLNQWSDVELVDMIPPAEASPK